MYPEFVVPTARPQKKIRNGLVWYAAILPALGLFLESYALNKYLGMLVWSIVIIARPAACLADRHILLRDGADIRIPTILAFLPTVYIFKRCFDLKQNTAIAVVCLISLSYGVIGNGFVVGLTMDDDKATEIVRNRYAASVAGVRGAIDPESFDTAINRALDHVSYDVERNGDERIVTVKGTDPSTEDKYVFVFSVVHDGYALTGFELKEVTLNGSTVEGDDRSELLKALLLPDEDTEAARLESSEE